MKGYLKGASTIHQCTRCFTLRDVAREPEFCISCVELLGVYTTTTHILPLADTSDDIMDGGTLTRIETLLVNLIAAPTPHEC